MKDRDTRAAIHKLAGAGHGKRTIASALGISKNTVKTVLESGATAVPTLERSTLLDAERDVIIDLHLRCKGNLVRVHEELAAAGISVAYPTLTAFCRRNDIGVTPKQPAGEYDFKPGQEMQHDTSPHEVTIAGKKVLVQCASLILCFSRKQYAQVYERWSRLECRHFLSEGVVWLGGAAGDCMLDNSTVIMVGGTGKNAVPAAEMVPLAQRFGFEFIAHFVGDADRSGRVERVFHYIENNFYVGRTFSSIADLNEQLLAWCERNFGRFRKRLGASPATLFRLEAPALKPLPLHVPEVYVLRDRRVSVDGYVNLHTNRYSVAARWIHLQVEVRETVDSLRVFHGHELIGTHAKLKYGAYKRQMLPEHRHHASRRKGPSRPPTEDERVLRAQSVEIAKFVDVIRKKHRGRAVRAMRQLHRLWREYPTEAVSAAIAEALKYGLTDIARIERMVLRRIAGDFFHIPVDDDEPEEGDHG